jgi:hypothetical protein
MWIRTIKIKIKSQFLKCIICRFTGHVHILEERIHIVLLKIHTYCMHVLRITVAVHHVRHSFKKKGVFGKKLRCLLL